MAESRTLRRYDSAIIRLLPSLMLYGWDCHKGSTPQAGDMVILHCAPPSEWTLSFYRETLGQDKHLLESLRTGALCEWRNVGFMVINTEKAGVPREAFWADDHFAFDDKFRKACVKGGFHGAVPFISRFDGDSAHLAFRTRWGLDENITPLVINGWQKITIKALLAALVAAEKEHESKKPNKEPTND